MTTRMEKAAAAAAEFNDVQVKAAQVRERRLVALKATGKTISEIALLEGISRQRVSFLLLRACARQDSPSSARTHSYVIIAP